MLKEIKKVSDVKKFASLLTEEGINFHPDNDFSDYINLKTRKPSFSKIEIAHRNSLMKQCFYVCKKNKVDIYNVMCRVYLLKSGLNKLIQAPVQVAA